MKTIFSKKKQGNKTKSTTVGILLLLLIVAGYVTHELWPEASLSSQPDNEHPVVVYDEDGKPSLSPKRKQKLEDDISKLQQREEAEQYALLARYNGWYPCLKCQQDSIYLLVDEVWRYGSTSFSKEGRYPSGVFYKHGKWKLTEEDLDYAIEFHGNYQECLVEEKKKIFNYPLLPECLNRNKTMEIFLVRPPGNKTDN